MSKLKEEFRTLGDESLALGDWARHCFDLGREREALEAYERALAGVRAAVTSLRKLAAADVRFPDYEEILRRCPPPQPPAAEFPKDFRVRLSGALYGRLAGCILGVPVEGWGIEGMRKLAEATGTPFPPTEYWHDVSNRYDLQYEESPRAAFAKDNLDCAPSDDDIMYVLLNLLLLERFGPDFTTEDVAALWQEEVTVVCTAEKAALEQAQRGVEPGRCAEGNPYVEWIGAAIRADAFGYVCPGDPRRAAALAYRDACFTHRGEGVYGEMFFAACIAAAFTARSPEQALRRALDEIPADCLLAEDIRWALAKSPEVDDHLAARRAMEERFGAMSWVRIRNNATLVVFALMMAQGDFTKAISSAVAMSMDNDCTGATVGSIMGALYGLPAIPAAWYECFHNRIRTFLRNHKDWRIDDVVERFVKLAAKFRAAGEEGR